MEIILSRLDLIRQIHKRDRVLAKERDLKLWKPV